MKKLIIITGVSGTGKTTLARILHEKLEDSILLSYDELSEKMYDIIGFKNKKQKEHLYRLNISIYKKLIKESMEREDKIVILEKPFKKEWKRILNNLVNKYEYQAYTINMFAKDFETIWNRLLKREKSKKERHPAHYLDSYYYNKRDKYKPFFEYQYKTFKKEYDNLLSNSINLGKVIDVEDIEKLEIDKLISKII